VDRVKKLSLKILENYKEKFGADFSQNKKTLEEITIVRSKGLKNELAGYITKFIKNELKEQKIKEEQNEKQNNSNQIDNSSPQEISSAPDEKPPTN